MPEKNIPSVAKPSRWQQILAFFILLGGLELIMADINSLRWSYPLVSGVVLLFILWLVRFRIWHKTARLSMIIPGLFCLGAITFLLFIPSPWLAHLYGLSLSLIFTAVVRNMNSRVSQRREKHDSFRLNDVFLLFCAFLMFSSYFGLAIFLAEYRWPLTIFLPLTIMLLTYQYFWHEGLTRQSARIYPAVIGLVFAEIGWALTFWPTGFISRTVVLFISFYCLLGLVKLYFSQRLVLVTARKYLVVSLVALALVLGTTKWFY